MKYAVQKERENPKKMIPARTLAQRWDRARSSRASLCTKKPPKEPKQRTFKTKKKRQRLHVVCTDEFGGHIGGHERANGVGNLLRVLCLWQCSRHDFIDDRSAMFVVCAQHIHNDIEKNPFRV
jgi:hypothetical protein